MATGSYPWIPPIKGSETRVASFTVPNLKTPALSKPMRPSQQARGGGAAASAGAGSRWRAEKPRSGNARRGANTMAERLDQMGGEQLRRKIESMGVRAFYTSKTRRGVQQGNEARKTMRLPTAASWKSIFIVFSTGIRHTRQAGYQCGLAVAQLAGS